ncbi:CaiB/BaiF CoA-transferase family protein [Amycolatopsis sp. GM8]|uniref:CaiB/BaiF CoA transferase family protein n=1 Tax=Amycolatopsis sp. GM8 TaxID=2896530 RepID=UPI001F335368|nr:CaiB/BaiF CoA-transferase family protein [Amycolatopsis sp. GM8]
MTTLLDGLRVLDLSLWQPGHYATQLLADLGAEVVKVEPPGGDRMRPVGDRFVNFNGHKKSVVLNLKDDRDRTALLDMVRDCEVVVENYRPGVAARLGVGFDQLRAVNPAIVLCSISGFGQTGPLAGTTGHDANYQAYAGAMTVADGHPPAPAGLLIGDQGSGLAAAFAILAAVVCARRTGEGEHIDVSMTDLLATWVAPLGAVDPRRAGMRTSDDHGGAPAMGTFRTRDDRWIVLGVYSEDHFWDALCDALGLGRYIGRTMAERSAGASALSADIAAAVATFEQTGLIEALEQRGVPVAPVLTRAEMLEHPHFRERGVLTTGVDGYLTIAHPIRYTVHPALPPGPAPSLPERDT